MRRPPSSNRFVDEPNVRGPASRDTTSPVPVLAVAGGLGAVLLAEGFQLGHRPADGAARGLVTLLVTVLSVAFGMFVSRGYTAPFRDPWEVPPATTSSPVGPGFLETVLRATGGALLAAGFITLALWRIVWRGGLDQILAGVATGTLIWAPVLVMLVHLHHRSARSRAGSLLRSCDERAVWFAVAAVALLGSTMLSFIPENTHLAGRTVARAVGVLALLLMPWFAGRNIVALARAWRLARTAASLRRTTELTRNLDVLDLGVGDEVFEERAGGSAYRTAPATRVVLGSPEATLRFVRRDARALGAIALVGLMMFGMRGLS